MCVLLPKQTNKVILFASVAVGQKFRLGWARYFFFCLSHAALDYHALG